MADATRVTSFEVGAQVDGEAVEPPPFTVAIKVQSPVRLDQLAAEVAQRAGAGEVPLMTEGDPATAHQTRPAFIWTEAEISFDALVGAAKDHQPDESWVRDESSALPSLEQVMAKVQHRRMLTPEEIQVALWELLGRS